jgi:hypothetical protein
VVEGVLKVASGKPVRIREPGAASAVHATDTPGTAAASAPAGK